MYSLKTLLYRLALFITFTTGLCFPQSDTGTIVGIVRDASGGVVPQAAAAVTNVSTGAVWRGFTNDEGFYRIANLPPSTYEVEIEAKGFRRSIGPPARVSAGEVLRVDADTFERNPATLDAAWKSFCKGIYRLDGNLLLSLDVANLLTFQTAAAA